MHKYLHCVLPLVLALVVLVSAGGAYATWTYAVLTPEDKAIEFPVTLKIFTWPGAEELPDDDAIGENHISLIDNIINHPQHGLNTKSSYLNEQIEDRQDGGIGWRDGRDTLGSMAVTQSAELTAIFGLGSSKLSFLIQFKSSTEYYIFTTGVQLGERGACNWLGNNSKPGSPTVPIGQNIAPIYKTVVQKVDGVWTAISTVEGYAKSAWYEESRSNANATQIPSFDPDTFVEGKLES